jgi:hypothetical protein
MLLATIASRKMLTVDFNDTFGGTAGSIQNRNVAGGKLKWATTNGQVNVNGSGTAILNSNVGAVANFTIAYLDNRAAKFVYGFVTLLASGLPISGDDGFLVFNFQDNNNFWVATGNWDGSNDIVKIGVVDNGVLSIVATSPVITTGTGVGGKLGAGDKVGIFVSFDYVQVEINFGFVVGYTETNRRFKNSTRYGIAFYNNGVAAKTTAYDAYYLQGY